MMYMIHYLVCRDPFSYDKLTIENAVFPSDNNAFVTQYRRACTEYKSYLERREEGMSMVKVVGYLYNQISKAWDQVAEWEYKLPLKKMTVVNPELEALRATKKADAFSKLKAKQEAFIAAAFGPQEPQIMPAPVFYEVDDND